jgi:hypothetical protein
VADQLADQRTDGAQPDARTTIYTIELDHALGALKHVKFTTRVRDVIDYAVVLLVKETERVDTIRVYDGAHAVNELHRYTRQGGKQAAEIFHGGTLGEGMRAAIEEVERNYPSLIEAWRTR